MVSSKKLFELLSKEGIEFYTGVPDSILKDFCSYVADYAGTNKHITASNEGGAIAMAIGFHLATERIGLVYLQNSGLGNAINPLVSLANSDVYGIPILLLIGWRGEDGNSDEPQHKKQGKITLPLLETLGIQYSILPQAEDELEMIVKMACENIRVNNEPYALVVRKKTFTQYEKKIESKQHYTLSREEALNNVISELPRHSVVISTTGKLSRELFELRETKKEGHVCDLLTVGGMGHASQIALAIALSKPETDIYCLDGDGAALMHLGGWGVIGQCIPTNYKHILFNNYAHDSVGGQPNGAVSINFLAVATACGYTHVFHAETVTEIKKSVENLRKCNGPALLEIRILKGSRKDLRRPLITPEQNKRDFMKFLHEKK